MFGRLRFRVLITMVRGRPVPPSGARMKTSMSSGVDIESADDALPRNTHVLSMHNFSTAEVSDVRAKLLAWYDANARVLPWRDPPNTDVRARAAAERSQRAYAVWVSEIMCQQTQVATVVGYYQRWMVRFPTVFDLAKAELEDVRTLWAGLGYYSRAKYLWEGARLVVDKFSGQLPDSAAGLIKITGIGRYTAGAVASIVHGEATPVVDGNVMRVLSRLRAIGSDTKAKKAVALYWELAATLVDPQRPGDFNQSMMELGATVCTPKNPACEACPLNSVCLARREVVRRQGLNKRKLTVSTSEGGDASATMAATATDAPCDVCDPSTSQRLGDAVTDYPVKASATAQRTESVIVTVVERRGEDGPQYLLTQRPAVGLLAGLWEFPTKMIDHATLTRLSSHTTGNTKASQKTLSFGASPSKKRRKAVESDDEDGGDDSDDNGDSKTTDTPLTVAVLTGPQCASLAAQYLVGTLTLPVSEAICTTEWRDAGSALHIFSHIRMHMRIGHLVYAGDTKVKDEAARAVNMRWVSRDELDKGAVGNQLKKALNVVEQSSSSKDDTAAPKAKGKAQAARTASVSADAPGDTKRAKTSNNTSSAGSTHRQASIASFFTPKAT